MSQLYDVAVIGGAVIGLSVADALLDAHPGLRLGVLEKESQLGVHTSGRDFGVIHAGFYYFPDSLKARLTRQGNLLLHQFCAEEGVAARRCGKLVVTQDEHELPALDELLARGRANGVPVESVDEQQARELEPLACTVERALWSPTTSSASPSAVLDRLASRVARRGGEIHLASIFRDLATVLLTPMFPRVASVRR